MKKKNGNADDQQQSFLVAVGETLPAHQLESIVEHIADEFRAKCENDETLKDLIGTKILSRALIGSWMNANALPKTQVAFIEMLSGDEEKVKAFEEARKKATDDDNPDKKDMRELLYKCVDTKVSIENGGTKIIFEFNQSQLFSAVASAIFRVFENTNLAGVSSKRKNSIEYVWWNAQLMFGNMCEIYGIEIEKNDAMVGRFVALRRNIQRWTRRETGGSDEPRRQTCTPMPTRCEIRGYLDNDGVRYKIKKIYKRTVHCKRQTDENVVSVVRRWMRSATYMVKLKGVSPMLLTTVGPAKSLRHTV